MSDPQPKSKSSTAPAPRKVRFNVGRQLPSFGLFPFEVLYFRYTVSSLRRRGRGRIWNSVLGSA